MSKVTREEMYETIVEMWAEDWEGQIKGDIWAELIWESAHGETMLVQYDDKDLQMEYQRALRYFDKKYGEIDVPDYGDRG